MAACCSNCTEKDTKFSIRPRKVGHCLPNIVRCGVLDTLDQLTGLFGDNAVCFRLWIRGTDRGLRDDRRRIAGRECCVSSRKCMGQVSFRLLRL